MAMKNAVNCAYHLPLNLGSSLFGFFVAAGLPAAAAVAAVDAGGIAPRFASCSSSSC